MRTWKTEHQLDGNPTVIAPCCGRPVAADMLVHTASLPKEKRGVRGADFECDGCLERLKRTGKLKTSELAAATGVAADKIARLLSRGE